MSSLFNTSLRMLLRDARLSLQAPGSIPGQEVKNPHEHRFPHQPSDSAAALLKILLSWRTAPKKKRHLLAWPVPRRAAVVCLGEAARFPLAKHAAKLGSRERAFSAAWDGGGSGSRQEL